MDLKYNEVIYDLGKLKDENEKQYELELIFSIKFGWY